MAKSTRNEQPVRKAQRQPGRDRGWTPFLIGGGVVLVIAIALSLALHNNAATAGTKLWAGEVTLKVGQEYGLEHPSAAIDATCAKCILVEDVYPFGMAISDSGGLVAWPKGAPTYKDCAKALRGSSPPAVALYDPSSNTSSSAARPGAYLCAFANSGGVLSLRYDGPTEHGGAFKFKATAWAVG
jgi:hypothetical protein